MAVSSPRPGLFRFGIFEVDFESGELWKQGRKIALHDQALRALGLLLEHPGEVVTREQFRNGLWPEDTFVDFDKSLNTTIRQAARCAWRFRQRIRDLLRLSHDEDTGFCLRLKKFRNRKSRGRNQRSPSPIFHGAGFGPRQLWL